MDVFPTDGKYTFDTILKPEWKQLATKLLPTVNTVYESNSNLRSLGAHGKTLFERMLVTALSTDFQVYLGISGDAYRGLDQAMSFAIAGKNADNIKMVLDLISLCRILRLNYLQIKEGRMYDYRAQSLLEYSMYAPEVGLCEAATIMREAHNLYIQKAPPIVPYDYSQYNRYIHWD